MMVGLKRFRTHEQTVATDPQQQIMLRNRQKMHKKCVEQQRRAQCRPQNKSVLISERQKKCITVRWSTVANFSQADFWSTGLLT